MSIHNAINGISIDNDGGVALGIRYDSEVLTSLGLGLSSTKTGSLVVDGTDTDPALSGGVFAYNNTTPIAKRLTSSLAGVNNDVLLSGAGRPDLTQSIHKIESVITTRIATAIRDGYWNISTGSWSTSPTSATDSFGNDNAARVSRSSPGSLTYKGGNPNVTTVGYSSKTN